MRDDKKTKRNGNGVLHVDRLPPNAMDAEQGILGCILLDWVQAMPVAIASLKAGSEEFYDLRNKEIYRTMEMMWEKHSPIDVITLQDGLKNRLMLDEVGGIGYVSSLPDMVPSAANIPYYLNIVSEKYLLRRSILTCTDLVGKIYEHAGEAEEMIDEAEAEIMKIRAHRVKAKTRTASELIKHAINKIEDLHANKGRLSGIETGFADLDGLTGGLQNGEMIILAARPSVGKTSLAMNIAEHVCVTNRIPVGVFSLEMSAESLMLRMLCSRARVNMRNVRDGFLAERDFPKLTAAAGKISSSPLYIEDQGGMEILQLRARARRMIQEHGIKLFVIDYLQLLNSLQKRRNESRQQEISDISKGVHEMAKELDVPVIALSQLNRAIDKEKNRKPLLSDLRESGSLEQDADVVALMYRPAVENQEDDGPPAEGYPVAVNIAKQRNGPANETINLTFLKSYTRFESCSKVSDDDVPDAQVDINFPYKND